MFQSVFPILTVRDVERSLGFYRDLLDGTVQYQFPPDGDPVYVSVVVGRSPVGIGLDDGTSPAAVGASTLWVYTVDVDAAVARLAAAGAPVVAEPADQAWGERTAQVRDPDGNTIHLGQQAG